MMVRIRLLIVSLAYIFISTSLSAQKVGLVLSGGGASGLAHIGVLKALEENDIPIDYITGTSIGGIVGAIYASGYSPKEIEALVKTKEFRDQAYGKIDQKYLYRFKLNHNDASWINIRLSLDSAFETNLPTNIFSPAALNIAMTEIFSGPAAAAKYNFDSLFIPFRSIASDITEKKAHVFSRGSLGTAVRASMTYPFYHQPISISDKLFFDGGLYNNFPSDIMYESFYPDIIIGSNVTSNAPMANEDNLLLQIRNMLVSKTNYSTLCENGIIIQPKTDISLFDFDNPQEAIDSGYVTAIRSMDSIKTAIKRRVNKEDLERKRNSFKQKTPEFKTGNITVTGLSKQNQKLFVETSINPTGQSMDVKKFRRNYYRLLEDENIKFIYPESHYDTTEKKYDITLDVTKEKDFNLYFGGNISNRPINTGYVGLQYNKLGKTSTIVFANTYFGKLYNSGHARIRFDFASRKLPFYIEPSITYNRWDYFNSNALAAFFEDIKPSYIIHSEQFEQAALAFPIGNPSILTTGYSLVHLIDKYYLTNKFSISDTADRTDFNAHSVFLNYEFNTLNKKIYATEGSLITFRSRYTNGREKNIPGSTATDTSITKKDMQWAQFKGIIDHYYIGKGLVRMGLYLEGVYSFQPFFNNYTASVIEAPSFLPIPESQTFFLEKYRANQYLAGGIKNIIKVKDFNLRLEGYVFMPYRIIYKQPDLNATYGPVLNRRYFIAMANLVYYSPMGPLSLSVNYYDQKLPSRWSFMFHMGYIIFNKRALE